YLEHARRRESKTKSGYHFEFESVTWIEGLERPDIRVEVVESMLREPARYCKRLTTELRRVYQGSDASPVQSLWMHAMRSSSWPLIPTARHGLVEVQRAFRLEPEQRRERSGRYAFLPTVRQEFDDSAQLLDALGIGYLSSASPERLIAA